MHLAELAHILRWKTDGNDDTVNTRRQDEDTNNSDETDAGDMAATKNGKN